MMINRILLIKLILNNLKMNKEFKKSIFSAKKLKKKSRNK